MATYYVDSAVGDDLNSGTSEGSGNAWATIQHAIDTVADGDTIYVKASADYEETVQPAVSRSVKTFLIGYGTSIDDNQRATVQGGNTRSFCINVPATRNNYVWRNFIYEGATSKIIQQNGITYSWVFDNCIFRPGTATPTSAVAMAYQRTLESIMVFNCLIEGFSSSGWHQKSGAHFYGCVFRNNGSYGLQGDSYTSVFAAGCLFAGNSWGIAGIRSCTCFKCTFYNNSSGAISQSVTSNFVGCVVHTHLHSSNAAVNRCTIISSAFFNNTTDTANSTTISSLSLSSDPYVDPANNDFSPLRGSDIYASMDSLPEINSYADIGAIQHADPLITPDFHPLS